jgi:23S rRNA (cytosine1962-C5)-methyltransferase
MLHTFSPKGFTDYELIDCGGFEKLERFGNFILARPEPQALWSKSLSEAEWDQRAHARFIRSKQNPEKGDWQTKKGMPESWRIKYEHQGLSLHFRLAMTAFKHVGIFPEQSDNWDYIIQKTQQFKKKGPVRLLNLFAYTGGASLAGAAAGADVTHVDSVKQVVTWSRENMEASNLDGIRWMVEDAFKFVQRENKRGKKYEGIILDPPAYGRGPDGEKWILEEKLGELLQLCKEILADDHFLVLNLYSLGHSATLAETLGNVVFNHPKHASCGELFVPDHYKKRLPLGIFYRFSTIE